MDIQVQIYRSIYIAVYTYIYGRGRDHVPSVWGAAARYVYIYIQIDTDKQMDRQIDRQIDGYVRTYTHICAAPHGKHHLRCGGHHVSRVWSAPARYIYMCVFRQLQIDRQIDKDTDRLIDRQIYRQIDRYI